ncbi:MAG: pilus assembly protein [Hyphomicrobiaceae bacterium]|nr:pilus assembly protein [Hyphomicrobiaceae bacterium]
MRRFQAGAKSLLRRWLLDRAGNISMMFVVLIIPLVACVGMAVDLGRAYRIRAIAQNAIDSAVLAAGKAAQTNVSAPLTAATTAATNYFNAAKPTNVLSSTIGFAGNGTNTEFTVTGTTWVATPFLSILSRLSNAGAEAGAPASCASKYGCLKIVTTATASIAAGGNGGSNVEISLMLDVTGSMDGSKITTLISAANDLVDTIIWTDQSQYTSRVAIVPFAPTVNAGSYFTAITGESTSQSTSCGWGGGWGWGWGWGWGGGSSCSVTIGPCVVDRTGTNAYTDVAPASGTYLPSLYSATGSTSSTCTPSTAIVPLTSDKTVLHATINSLTASGGTAGPLGTAFAYYLLSPDWASVWGTASTPAPYSDLTTLNSQGAPKLQKYAILMTDGDYNIMSGSNASTSTANTAALALCTAMKNRGIVVYTVGFEVGTTAKTMLTSCATSSGHFYDASSESALIAAFRDIALKISSLRLTN